MSQKILQYVEIDIDYCSLTYGVAPCTAAIPTTGAIKCFNSLATCQDRPHFTNAPVTLRFAVPTNYLPSSIDCIPDIKSIAFEPAVISLGQNLGQRATLTVSFDDHRHSDTGAGFDKYLASRSYDPYSQGTFWGKFAARQPFVRGRPLRWIVGNTDQALSEMETRHYIIDSFSGPDNNGVFKLIAKDVLKLADGDRALAPAISTGFLTADITAAATSFTISPAGAGATYPASGFINIGGSEICSFTRSGDVFTITRAQLGTVAGTHAAQDRVQIVLRYSGIAPDVIIADLLVNYADVPAAYIPTAEWAAEITAHLNRVYTATIAQPTSVNALVSELIEQAGLSLWWNDRDQEIGLLVLRGLIYTNYLFTEQNVIADTLEIAEQPDKRLSQVHTYFGQINPLTSLTDKANFRSASRIIDAQAETDYGSPAIKEIFSRWIPALGRTVADRLGTILLGRFKDPPRKIGFSFLRNSTTSEIVLAGGYQVQAWPLQDVTGANETVNVQVTRLRPNPDMIQAETEEVIFTAPAEDLTKRNIIVDANNYNINLRTAHDAIFPAPVAGITVILTVNDAVKIGSTSTVLNSLTIGDWPAGVTIIVHVIGRIQGTGGKGFDAWTTDPNVCNGGPAIYTRYPIKLSCPGQIYGGGGGGGYAYYVDGSSNIYLWGAGGGCGFNPGAGGLSNPNAGSVSGGSGTTETYGAGFGYAGRGGGPGENGAAGGAPGGGGSAGNPAGAAIDGLSFVTKGTWNGTTFTPGTIAGSILGPQIN